MSASLAPAPSARVRKTKLVYKHIVDVVDEHGVDWIGVEVYVTPTAGGGYSATCDTDEYEVAMLAMGAAMKNPTGAK